MKNTQCELVCLSIVLFKNILLLSEDFECQDGTFIVHGLLCDGYNDCFTGEDEYNCGNVETVTAKGLLRMSVQLMLPFEQLYSFQLNFFYSFC